MGWVLEKGFSPTRVKSIAFAVAGATMPIIVSPECSSNVVTGILTFSEPRIGPDEFAFNLTVFNSSENNRFVLGQAFAASSRVYIIR
jgi:hypothetical protein